jgi:ankyrin repeat protein
MVSFEDIQNGEDILVESGQELWAAIESGDRDKIELLFSRGAHVNEKNKDGDTPLQWAMWRGRPDLVRLLISHGADYTIFAASSVGDMNRVKDILIANPSEANARERIYGTPLHLACAEGHKKVAALLISYGAEIDAREWRDETPLLWASQEGHIEVVELLISKGADVRQGNWEDMTPLHWASRKGHKEVAALLIDSGADVNALSGDNEGEYIADCLRRGDRPLHMACAGGHKDVVRLLLSKGARVNVMNKSGETPSSLAKTEEIVALFRQHGASL